MRKPVSPATIHAPFGQYSPGVVVQDPLQWLFTSGQLGISKDGAIPESVTDQALLCFQSLGTILACADMSFDDVLRITGYVTDRAYFPDYMAVRDRFIGDPAPASTLLIVGGFTRPEFKVEVEIVAARATA
jgi:enamine deaminase RidA (YjgF/YER057c/UK114 family)